MTHSIGTTRGIGLPGVDPPAPDRLIPAWDGAVPRWAGAGPPRPSVWWLGVHGGAGVTTLVLALPDTGDAGRRIPGRADALVAPIVAVCRSTMAGLEHAQDLARQQAAGLLPAGVRVAGLVTVADAPGRPPIEVRQYRLLVAGGFPRMWEVPWLPQWRNALPTGALPGAVKRLARELTGLAQLDSRQTLEAAR